MNAVAAAALAKTAPLTAGPALADSDHGKGSPIGLFVVLLLVVATYLLYRSMSRHLRRVPERFPGDGAGSDGAGLDGAGLDGAGLDGAGLDDAEVRPVTPEAAGGPAGTDGAAGEETGSATPAAGTGSRLGTESGERTGPS